MTFEELTNTLTVIKWVYPLVTISFTCVVGLLIYIWKSHTKRQDELMKGVLLNLTELQKITTAHRVEIQNLKGAVFNKKAG